FLAYSLKALRFLNNSFSSPIMDDRKDIGFAGACGLGAGAPGGGGGAPGTAPPGLAAAPATGAAVAPDAMRDSKPEICDCKPEIWDCSPATIVSTWSGILIISIIIFSITIESPSTCSRIGASRIEFSTELNSSVMS
ncbi:MAG: hypothetical protein ACTSRE_09225, partial [Promethearchaeota archaeon]